MVAMLAVGVLAAVVTGLFGEWTFAPVAFAMIVGWAAACVTYILWVWLIVGAMDAATTARHATREDPSRATSELLVLLASLASLGGIGFLLFAAHAASVGERGLLAGVAVVSVGLSWALIHTLYTLRYASLYYRGVVGGIDFNQEELPRYSDFAYLSFTLGMTYQVSDTNLQNHEMRVTALRHGLLSFPFGSGILATVINLVAGLLS